MRIATTTMTNMATNAMNNAYNKYAQIINKITANRNFTHVSENVPDATRVLKLNDQLSKLNQYQSNIEAATNEMNMAYDALGDAQDEISSINALIVEASNATTTPDSAKAIAQSIREKVNTITDKMNQKYLDNYIFSGTFTQEQTYVKEQDANGVDVITYKGSPQAGGNRNVTIAENTEFAYNITAEEIFGSSDDPDNFFNKMQELDDLLTSEPLDYDAIRAMLKTTGEATSKVTEAQGRISAKVTKLDTTKTINNSTITSLTEQKVELEEVDITKAAGELASARTALQASYMMGTNVLQSVSLLDYI